MNAPRNQILVGDCVQILKGLPEGFAQTCITSPPYWGLRDYGTTGLVAKRLGRDFVGIELNPEYAAIAQRRLSPAMNRRLPE